MTPKEKANELVELYAEAVKPIEFGIILERDWKTSKQCALIAVDEILESNSNINVFIASKDVKYKNKAETEVKSDCKENLKYWQQVKKEIERL